MPLSEGLPNKSRKEKFSRGEDTTLGKVAPMSLAVMSVG